VSCLTTEQTNIHGRRLISAESRFEGEDDDVDVRATEIVGNIVRASSDNSA